jgi:hypothetical protein
MGRSRRSTAEIRAMQYRVELKAGDGTPMAKQRSILIANRFFGRRRERDRLQNYPAQEQGIRFRNPERPTPLNS